MKRTLFLNPPSYEGFDGGAGSRYQARREVRSFWYPTWLAQPAAMVPGSTLIDAPPAGLGLADVLRRAGEFELCFVHTSTPSFGSDVRTAEALKETNPHLQIGFVGPHVAVQPEAALEASRAIDFVTRLEFDHTCAEVAAGRPLDAVDGLSYRTASGAIAHTRDRGLTDMDALPWVVDVYQRDLRIEDYEIGEALYPFVSFYGGRGCRSKCTFCLWPYTVGGHTYRVRSPANVVGEVTRAVEYFPQIREVFFDDDTMTDARPWVEEVARGLGRVLLPRGMTWSTNAKVNVPYDTLKVLKENGLRLFTVGFESGSQTILNNVKKGMKVEWAREFAANCHRLGIKMHGTFIVGLPGETRETIRETIEFVKEINPHTIQVSLPAPMPGTFLYDQALREGWLREEPEALVGTSGFQVTSLEYPHLSHAEIFAMQEQLYREFFFRPRKIAEIFWEMLKSPMVMRRRLREGVEFFHYLRTRQDRPAGGGGRKGVAGMGLKVVVTGGSGFIGSHVVDALVAAGHAVTIIDHRVAPHRRDVGFEDVDLLDLASVVAVLRGADHVFHLGAVANVNYAFKYPVYTASLNVMGTTNILEAARIVGVGRVHFASTVWVYNGAPEGLEADESVPFYLNGAGHLYTSTKMTGEMLCHNYHSLYGVPFTVLRYGIPYGPRMREELLIPLFIKRALAGEPLTVAGKGDQYRRFVYVQDLAAAHVLALDARAEGQTYNLEGSEKITVLEVARGIRALLGERVRIEFGPDRPGDFGGREVSAAKARDELGWTPQVGFADGLRRTVEWFCDRWGDALPISARGNGHAAPPPRPIRQPGAAAGAIPSA